MPKPQQMSNNSKILSLNHKRTFNPANKFKNGFDPHRGHFQNYGQKPNFIAEELFYNNYDDLMIFIIKVIQTNSNIITTV